MDQRMGPYARRIRAARSWADLSQIALADELGVEEQTIKRREAGKNGKRAERIAIAQVCGVPPEFLEEGFGGEAASEISKRLARVEALLAALANQLLDSDALLALERELLAEDQPSGEREQGTG